MTTIDATGTLHDAKGRFAGHVAAEPTTDLPVAAPVNPTERAVAKMGELLTEAYPDETVEVEFEPTYDGDGWQIKQVRLMDFTEQHSERLYLDDEVRISLDDAATALSEHDWEWAHRRDEERAYLEFGGRS